jgi:outer membrane protein OmpA-like peptidoglycan-associated protein
MLRRTIAGALASAAMISFFACGGPSERHCAAESAWDGSCQLKGVTKLREAELPVPHAVYEALYEPQPNPSNPNYTPPAIRKELHVLGNQELELEAYLKQNEKVPCHMAAPAPGDCTPGQLALELPPFAPTGAQAANEVHGCAQIEHQATQDKLPELSKNAASMPEVFLFAESSARASDDAVRLANAVAARMTGSPGIECVAIVGQISPGEAPGLAADRARTVRQLLEAGGVAPGRLTTITITENVYGTGTGGPATDPNKRRVTLRILLQR